MFKSKNIQSCWLFTLLFLLPCFTVNSQDDFASIRKNINYRAKFLKHYLNETKDTLVLSSPRRIYRLYSVGNSKVNIDKEILDFEYKLPLRHLEIGRYVMVTQLNGLKIVFELNILKKDSFISVDNNDLASNEKLVEEESVVEVKITEDKVEKSEKIIKHYNLSDRNREGMQTRDELRRLKAKERAKYREEIKKKRFVER